MSRLHWAGKDPHPPPSSILPDTPVWITRDELIRDAGFDPAHAWNGAILHAWDTKRYEHPVNAIVVYEDGNFQDGTRFAISKETADKPLPPA